jgi:UDP-N-acetylmuramoyl-tripeptide--D-alanyl-D-alanine ligase
MELIRPAAVAIITTAAPVHLEGFGDMDGVAKAKAEIFEGLAQDGTAVLNADDHYCDYWFNLDLVKGKKVITFGMEHDADVTATDIKFDDDGHPIFVLHTPQGKTDVYLPLLGRHNVMNALAAAAGALAVGISVEQMKAGLESVQPVYRRSVTFEGYAGAKIIDDSYNANPRAVGAVLEMLSRQRGEKIFVLGDMRELGKDAEYWHEQAGKMARANSIDVVYAYGKYSEIVAKAFGKGGRAFHDKQELAAELKKNLHSNCVVLVKGSLGTKMDEVVNLLKK